MLVTVITPTTGNPLLSQAIQSVQQQDYDYLEHLIVIDGLERKEKAIALLETLDFQKQTYVICLPYATGKDRFNGHRIYGASSYLANGDYFTFLDEDNWWESHHIPSLVHLVKNQEIEWAYSLRNIIDQQGDFITTDDCESLGKWPSWMSDRDHLIDINCYFLKKEIAVAISPLWYRKFREPGIIDVDRAIYHRLSQSFPNFETSGLYTVNYRVGSTALSVQAEFFVQGNQVMQEKYPHGYPWRHFH